MKWRKIEVEENRRKSKRKQERKENRRYEEK